MIHGGIGKINPTANVAHTIGIAKPGKIVAKGKEGFSKSRGPFFVTCRTKVTA